MIADPPAAFWFIGAVIVLGAVLIPIRIATLGRIGRRVGALDRILLIVAIVLGGSFLAFTIVGSVFSLRQKLVDGVYSTQLSVDGGRIAPPHSGTAHVSQVYLSEAWANVAHLSPGLTALVIVQHALGVALYGLIIGSGIYLCIRVLVGRPFARSMTVMLWLTAFALIVVGSASDVVGEVVRNQLTAEALGPGVPPAPYQGGVGFSFPGGYLLAGFAVAAIAVAFGAGARVQRDAEGLV